MADYINILDLKKIYIDYFLGGIEYFMFAFIILMSYVCAKFQMSNRNYLILLAICSLLFAGYIGEALYILIIMVIGFVSFKSIARIIT